MGTLAGNLSSLYSYENCQLYNADGEGFLTNW